MSEYMDMLLAPDQQNFTVDDDQKALWCVKKIREAQQEANGLLRHYEEQAKKVCETLDGTVSFFQSKLFPYFQTVPHKTAKTQESYSLPGAKLILKHQDPAYERDEEKLLAFLKASGRTACIKTVPATEKPSWADYKPLTKVVGNDVVDIDTGEVVKGVTVTAQPDKFEVKIDA